MKKRMIGLLLTAAMLFSFIPTVGVALGTPPENDLEILGASVFLNGKTAQDGDEARQGDPVGVAVQWRAVNNIDVRDERFENGDVVAFSSPFVLTGVALGLDGAEPLYTEDGSQLGTLAVDAENELLIVKVPKTLVEQGYSDISGSVLLSGTVDHDRDLTRPDKETFPLGLQGNTVELTYRNEGSVGFTKSGADGKKTKIVQTSDGAYIEYMLTLTLRDIMKNVSVTDTLDELLVLDPDSIQVTGADNFAVTAANDGGFTVTFPDVTGKKETREITVFYRARLRDDGKTSLFELNSSGKPVGKTLKNDAVLSFTDDQGEPQEKTAGATTAFKLPSVSKTGGVLTAYDSGLQEDSPVYLNGSYNSTQLYYYPMLYTLTLDPGDMAGVLAKTADAALDLTDAFSSSWTFPQDDNYWLLYYPGGPNMLNLMNLANGQSIQFSTAMGNTVSLGSEALQKAAANAQKLFHIANEIKQPFAADESMYLTLSDFEKNDSTGQYTLEYLIFVPSDQIVKETVTNTVSGTLAQVPVSDSVGSQISSPLGPVLVKGADDRYPGGSYNADAETYSFGREIELEDGEIYDEVDYAVVFNPVYLKDIYDADGAFTGKTRARWNDMTAKVSNILICDAINGRFLTANGKIVSTGAGSGLTLPSSALDAVSIEVYKGASPSAGQSYPYQYNANREAFLAAEQALVDYLETYGTAGAPKEGFELETVVQLWNTYNAARNQFVSGSGFVGSLQGTDITDAGIGVSVDNGQLQISVPFDRTLSLKQYDYNPGGAQTGSGAQIANFTSLIGSNYYFVVRYRAAVSQSAAVSAAHPSQTFANGASVYFGSDTELADDAYPPVYYNTLYTVTTKQSDRPENPVKLSKSALTSLTFSEGPLTFAPAGEATLGWRISVDVRNAKPGQEIEITDTLPEGLRFGFTGETAADSDFFAYSGTASEAVSIEDARLDGSFYDLHVQDATLTINFTFTEALETALGGNRYIYFCFSTQADELYRTAPGSKRITNTVGGTQDAEPLTSASATTALTVPPLLTKQTTTAQFDRDSSEPVYENGMIYGYYKLTVNPAGADLIDASDTLAITDTMTDAMTLDKASLRAVDADGRELGVSAAQNGSVWTFTVPDETALTLTYRVKFNVDPTADPDWMREENTGNTAGINGLSSGFVPESAVNYSAAQYRFSIRITRENADVTVLKYTSDGGVKKPLNGAVFTIQSVFDNRLQTYSPYDPEGNYDYIAARYPDGLQITNETDPGTYTLESLPLDRIFLLRETGTPDGYVPPEAPVYFVIAGEDFDTLWQNLPEELPKNEIVVFASDAQEKLLEIENERRVIEIEKVDEAGKPLPGAVLQILNAKGEVEETWTTDGSAHTVKSLLPVGTYTLREASAPEGYTVAPDQTFTVNATDKKITVQMTNLPEETTTEESTTEETTVEETTIEETTVEETTVEETTIEETTVEETTVEETTTEETTVEETTVEETTVEETTIEETTVEETTTEETTVEETTTEETTVEETTTEETTVEETTTEETTVEETTIEETTTEETTTEETTVVETITTEEPTSGKQDGSGYTEPNTGDDGLPMMAALIGVLLLMTLAGTSAYERRKKRTGTKA